MGFRRALIFGLLAGLSFVAHTAVAAGPIPECDRHSADHCGFDRAEDLATLTTPAGARWVLVAQADPGAPLVFLENETKRRVVAVAADASHCKGEHGTIDAGGARDRFARTPCRRHQQTPASKNREIGRAHV